MATTTSSTRVAGTDGSTDKAMIDGVADTARHIADSVAGAAGEVTARLPEAAATTRDVLDEANRIVHAGSDQTLKVAGALSIGLALGLLIGGAHRLLVLAALVPAALIGSTIVERSGALEGSRVQGR